MIVDVIPSVLAAGGNALDLNCILLSQNTRIPNGYVLQFPNETAVADYFGANSIEASLATVYFLGYVNSLALPGVLFFWRYNETAQSAWLRGGQLTGMTLTELQAINGTLSVTVDSVVYSGTINLSAATSFTNAASIIAATLGLNTAQVSYDSILNDFVISSLTTGTSSTLQFATGATASSLALTQATGAFLSQGVVASTPAGDMTAITAITQNWATFMLAWTATTDENTAFALWNNGQNNRYMFSMWTSNIVNTEFSGPSADVAAINAGDYSGISMNWDDSTIDTVGGEIAMLVCSYGASLNFNATNGRTTGAFRTQTGLAQQVVSATAANYLIGNGLNFYGDFTTANQAFIWYYPGSVSGPFQWVDSYLDQIYFNSQLQLAGMLLLQNVPSIPFNATGQGLIHSALLDPIISALNFGIIRQGVQLSQLQIAEANNLAGAQIDTILSTVGWYLSVNIPSPQVRAARGPWNIVCFYVDGQSCQQITIDSILVQ
jgi:hypothetical protein